jgi:hypothetical protein
VEAAFFVAIITVSNNFMAHFNCSDYFKHFSKVSSTILVQSRSKWPSIKSEQAELDTMTFECERLELVVSFKHTVSNVVSKTVETGTCHLTC